MPRCWVPASGFLLTLYPLRTPSGSITFGYVALRCVTLVIIRPAHSLEHMFGIGDPPGTQKNMPGKSCALHCKCDMHDSYNTGCIGCHVAHCTGREISPMPHACFMGTPQRNTSMCSVVRSHGSQDADDDLATPWAGEGGHCVECIGSDE